MPQVERKARNQVLFREVNERIAELAERLDSGARPEGQRFICECSRIGCTQMIEVELEVYAEVRVEPTRFLVAPGHEDEEHEEILRRLPTCLIVRTRPDSDD